MISRAATAFIRGGIRFYQRFLNPLLKAAAGPAAGCRYTPTCSHYFLGAVETHGPLKGSWIGICRIFRCHPWGGYGYDPVPPAGTPKKPQHDRSCGCGSHHSH